MSIQKILFTIVVLALLGYLSFPWWKRWFYPSAIQAQEAFSKTGKKLSFQAWNSDLQNFVDSGYVKYSEWKQQPKGLEQTLQQLQQLQTEEIARDHLLAAYINAYNAFTVQLILEHLGNIKGIQDIPKQNRWDAKRWKIDQETLSLNEIEHQILREKFIEPRIHFAIVCASIGCPHLLAQAYEGEHINAQLNQVTHDFFARPENLKISGTTVYLSPILDWFRGDFVRDELATQLQWFPEEFLQASTQKRLLMFVAKFAPSEIQQQLQQDYSKWSIAYSPYDWGLNGK